MLKCLVREVHCTCRSGKSRSESGQQWREEQGEVAILGKLLESHMVHIQAETFLALVVILYLNCTHDKVTAQKNNLRARSKLKMRQPRNPRNSREESMRTVNRRTAGDAIGPSLSHTRRPHFTLSPGLSPRFGISC